MKKLSELLQNIDIIEQNGNTNPAIFGIALNSKEVQKEFLFAAVLGEITDGHQYIKKAIENGANAIICEKFPAEIFPEITYILVNDTREAFAQIAKNFYDNPSSKLQLVGVTGTNGKTTIVTLLYNLFSKLGYTCGLISTVQNKIGKEIIETERTTPDTLSLNKLLSEMVDTKCKYVFMEVSSHAVIQKRIFGLTFAGGIFTNLTQDHLDYHKTIEEYAKAKQAFFTMLPENAFALSNKDDAHGEMMLQNTNADKYFYSLKEKTDFSERVETKLIGEFNMYNVLAIYGAAILLDQDENTVKEILKELEPAIGRFDYFKSGNGITGIVDYAHTPDAVKNVLETIQKMKMAIPSNSSGQVITVIGCGGDRDKTKRPVMAALAYSLSDLVILTSDNPRTENPLMILEGMVSGLPNEALIESEKVSIIPDRHEAIKKACELAKENDIILVAGKGHETYQEINGVKTHFDDKEELQKYLK